MALQPDGLDAVDVSAAAIQPDIPPACIPCSPTEVSPIADGGCNRPRHHASLLSAAALALQVTHDADVALTITELPKGKGAVAEKHIVQPGTPGWDTEEPLGLRPAQPACPARFGQLPRTVGTTGSSAALIGTLRTVHDLLLPCLPNCHLTHLLPCRQVLPRAAAAWQDV